jgi:hypothetical protein
MYTYIHIYIYIYIYTYIYLNTHIGANITLEKPVNLQALNEALATMKQEKLNESEKKKVNSRRIPNTAVKNNGVCIFLYVYLCVCVCIYT